MESENNQNQGFIGDQTFPEGAASSGGVVHGSNNTQSPHLANGGGNGFMSLAEAGRQTGYHQDYLGFLCRTGKLSGFKIGRNWVTTQQSLDEFLRNYKNGIQQVVDDRGNTISVHAPVVPVNFPVTPPLSMQTENLQQPEVPQPNIPEPAVSQTLPIPAAEPQILQPHEILSHFSKINQQASGGSQAIASGTLADSEAVNNFGTFPRRIQPGGKNDYFANSLPMLAAEDSGKVLDKLNSLKDKVLVNFEDRVEKISQDLSEIDSQVSEQKKQLEKNANSSAEPDSNIFLPILGTGNFEQASDRVEAELRRSNIKNRFTSNFDLAHETAGSTGGEEKPAGLKIKKLYASFKKKTRFDFAKVMPYALIALLIAGFLGSIFWANLFGNLSGNSQPQLTRVIYQNSAGGSAFGGGQQAPTQIFNGPVTINRTVNQVLGFSDADIFNLIDNRLNLYLAEGKFKGDKGDQGIQGAQGPAGAAGGLQNGVGFIPPNPANNFPGGSIASFTFLSSENFVTNNATVNNTFVSNGGATFNGPTVFNGVTNLSGTTTITNLNVSNLNPGFTQGSVVFQGVNGLAQDNANFFYTASTSQLSLGTTTPSSSAILELDSTNKGFLAPRMTTAQINLISNPATGLLVYNTDTNLFNAFNGTIWLPVSGVWSNILAPTGNLALNMNSFTSTFTFGSSTGSSSLFNLIDTANNTGTGTLFTLTTAAGSALNPFSVTASGTPALFVSAAGSTTIANLTLAQPLSLSSGGLGFNASPVQKGGLFAGTGTSTVGILPVGADGLCLLASSTAATGITWTSCSVAANAITSLNGQTNPVQTFATGTDPNITLTISSALGVHTFTPGFTGQLSVPRGGTGLSNVPLGFLLMGSSSTSTLATIATGSAGSILTMSGNIPTWTATATLATNLGAFIQGGNTFGTTARLGTLDNNDLNIITNGTTKLTVLANGNVGIGSATPSAQLTVQGTSTAPTINPLVIASSSGATLLTVLANGNVGIGTGSPASIVSGLDINGNGNCCFQLGLHNTANNNFFALGVDNTNSFIAYSGRMTWQTFPGLISKMTLTSGGNLGIGTTGPSANLQVVQATTGVGTVSNAAGGTTVTGVGTQFTNTFKVGDTITIGGQTVAISAIANDTSMTTAAITNANVAVAYTLAGGSRFSVLGNGNVGIGTTTPAQTFSVAGNMRLTGAFFDANNASGTAGQILTSTGTGTAWTSTSTLATSLGAFIQGGNTFGATGTLGTLDNFGMNFITNSTTKMTILANGNVGIGTTSPASKLDIQGTSGATLLSVGVAGDNGDTILIHGFNATIKAADSALVLNSASTMFFQISGSNKMAISNLGNVGIGTTTPAGLLDVVGTSSVTTLTGFVGGRSLSIVNTDQTNNNAAGLAFRTLDANGLLTTAAKFDTVFTSHAANAVSGDMVLLTNNAGTITEKLRVTAAGNVGIGTTTPQQTLSVAGNMQLTGAFFDANNASGTNGQILTSTGIGTAWTSTSTLASSLGAFIQGGNTFGATGTLGTLDNFGLNFITNSTTKMTILPNGNVGIGTINPGSPLDITGTSNTGSVPIASFFANNRAQNLALTFNSVIGSNALFLQSGAANDIAFNTNGANERMRITSGGNVGIGTATPDQLLNVSGALFSKIRISSASSSGFSQIQVDKPGQIWSFGLNDVNNNFIVFDNTVGAIGANRLTIAAVTGNVGIGTSGPSGILEVFPPGTGRTAGALRVIDKDVTIGVLSTLSGDNTNLHVVARSGQEVLSVNTGNLEVGVGAIAVSGTSLNVASTAQPAATSSYGLQVAAPSGATNNYAAAFSGGNVGIGTSTPQQTLSVAGNMRLTGALFDANNASGTTGMLLSSTGTGTQWIATSTLGISNASGTPGNVQFAGVGNTFNASSLFTFDNTLSRLAIGTTSTSSTLTLQGQAGTAPLLSITSSTGASLLTVLANGNVSIPNGTLAIAFPASLGNNPRVTIDTAATSNGGTSNFGISIISGGTTLTDIYSGPSNNITQPGGKSGTTINSPCIAEGTQCGVALATAGNFVLGVTGNGRVGVGSKFSSFGLAGGTLLPSTLLQVFGNAGATDPFDVSSSSGISVLRVTANQRVGIGTTTPSATLLVQGTSTAPALDIFTAASSSGTSFLTVTASGNVGIGTTTPQQLLSVAGNMRLTGALFDASNASGTTGMLLSSTGTGTQWIATSTLGISNASGTPGNVQFAGVGNTFNASSLFTFDNTLSRLAIGTTSTSSTLTLQGQAGSAPLLSITSSTGASLLTVFANGNVGIGTTTQSAVLSVIDSLGVTANSIANNAPSIAVSTLAGTANPQPQIIIAAGATNWIIKLRGNGLGTLPSNPLTFETGGGAVAALTTGGVFLANGLVAGTITAPPTNTLTSSGNASIGAGYYSVAAPANGLIVQGNTGIGTTTPVARLSVTGTGAIDPFDISSTSGISLFRVTQAGNVGIGTSTPAQTLSVAGNMRLTGAFFDASNASGTSGQILTSTGTGTAWSSTSTLATSLGAFVQGGNSFGTTAILGTLDNFGLNFITNSTTKLTILPNGNVGIGTTSPTANLFIGNSTSLSTATPVTLSLGGTFSSVAGQNPKLKLYDDGSNSIFGLGVSVSEMDFIMPNTARALFGTNVSLQIATPLNVSFGGTFGNSAPGSRANLKWDMYNDGANNLYGIGMSGGLMEYQAGTTGSHEFFVDQGTPVMIICGGTSCIKGNVGIGTTTPQSTLAVVGSSSTLPSLVVQGTSTQITVLNVTTSTGASLLAVLGSGNVGIGTSSPAQKLSVAGNMRLTGAFFDANNASGTLGMFLQSTGTSTQWVATSTLGIAATAASGTPGNVQFAGVGNTFNASSLFTFDNTLSRLAIGTTSTSSTLTLQGQAGTAPLLSISSSTGASLLTVLANGNVGIGTINPGSPLDVTGTSNTGSVPIASFFANNRASNLALTFNSVIGSNGLFLQSGAANDMVFNTNGASEKMRITSGGNVGIGTSTPSQLLSVAGNMQLTGAFFDANNASGTNGQILTSTGTGTAWTASTTVFGGTLALNGNTLTLQGGNTTFTGTNSITSSTISTSTISQITINGGGNTLTLFASSTLNQNLTTTSTPTFAGLTLTNALTVQNGGTGTSTAFAAGSVIFSNGTSFAQNNTNFFWNNTNAQLGLGTSTTSGLLTLQGSAASVTNLLNITSSTGASLLNVSWFGGLSQNISSTTAVNIQDGGGNSVFAVDSTNNPSNAGIDITAGGSQTGNLLNVFSSGQTLLSGISAFGGWFENIASTTAMFLQNGSGVTVFNVDTLNRRLGINTTTGPTLLSVQAFDQTTDLFDISSTSGASILRVTNGGLIGINSSTALTILDVKGLAGATDILNVASSSGVSVLRVTATGQVGVGTTTPTQLLTVAGNMRLTGAFFDGSNASGTIGQILTSTGTSTIWSSTTTLATSLGAFIQGGNTFGATGTLGTLDNFGLNFITNSTTKMTILPNGNVGIGTTTPASALHVAYDATSTASTKFSLQLGNTPLTAPSANGTYLALNAPASFSGNLMNLQVNGTNILTLSSIGVFSIGGSNSTVNASTGNFGNVTGTFNGTLNVLQSSGASTLAFFAPTWAFGNSVNAKLGGNNFAFTGAGSVLVGTTSAMSTFGVVSNSSTLPTLVVQATSSQTSAILTVASSSGATFLTVLAAGNVGIGTTTPQQLLSVAGNMRLTGAFFDSNNSSGTVGQILTSTGTGTAWSSTTTLTSALGAFIQGGNSFGATGTLGTLDNFGMNFITNSTTKMTILTNGNVGIGSPSPNRNLEVSGGSTGAVGQAIRISYSVTPTLYYGELMQNFIAAGQGFRYNFNVQDADTGFTGTAMSIQPNGTIGIGTTTPLAQLQIVNASSTSRGLIVQAAAGQSANIQEWRNSAGAALSSVDPNGWIGIGSGTPGSMLAIQGVSGAVTNLLTIASSTGASLLTVLSNGNVGIGTASPVSTFAVAGTSTMQNIVPAATLTYNLGASSTRWSQLWAGIVNVGTSTWSILQGNDGRLAFNDQPNGAGTERFSILTSSGNVGINTSTPTAKLMVQGTAGSTTDLFTVSSSTGAALFTVASNGSTTISSLASALPLRTTAAGVLFNGAINLSSGSNDITGILGSANGGSGTTTSFTGGSVIFSNGTSLAQNNSNFFWDNTNNRLGLGTTAPQQLLSVAGNMRLTGAFFDANNASGTNGQILTSTGTGTAWTSTSTLATSLGDFIQGGNSFGATGTLGTLDNNALNIITNGTTKLTVLPNGNVGIGTTSPQALLHLSQSAASPIGLQIENPQLGGTISTRITLNNSALDGAFPSILDWNAFSTVFTQRAGRNNFGQFQFNTVTGGVEQTRLAISNAGNVGIGTTSPTTLLTVGNNNQFTVTSVGIIQAGVSQKITITPDFTGTGEFANGVKISESGTNSLNLFAGDGSGGAKIILGYFDGTITRSALEVANTAAGFSNLLLMKSGGNVGIGTTSPAFGLDVAKGTFTTARFWDQTATTGSTLVAIRSGVAQGTNDLFQVQNPSGTVFASIDSTGRFVSNAINGDSNFAAQATTAGQLGFKIARTDGTFGVLTYLYAPGNTTDFRIFHGGADRLTILTGGNVGIGTTAPQQLLSVAGNMRLTGAFFDANNASGTNGQILTSTGTGTAWTSTSTFATNLGAFIQGGNTFGATGTLGTLDNFGLNFITNSTTKMTILPNGNVGIGISSPTQKLVVAGSAIISDTGGTSDTVGILDVFKNNSVSVGDVLFSVGSSQQTGQFVVKDRTATVFASGISAGAKSFFTQLGTSQLSTQLIDMFDANRNLIIQSGLGSDIVFNSNGATERMRIASGGSIGIGTTSTSSSLTLQGQAGSAPVLTITSSTGSTMLTVLANGNVGIGTGTTTPTSPLQVIAPDSTTVPILSLGNAANITNYLSLAGNRGIVGVDSTNGIMFLGAGASKGLEFFVNGTNAWETGIAAMAITTLGNAGIGTIAPTARFQVAQATAGVGTVTTAGTTALVGAGTDFLNAFKVGDTITVSGETVRTIAAITNNTNLTVTVAFSTSASGLSYTQVGGTRLAVLGNGNVGIGTTTPSNLLHIVSSAGAATLINLQNTNGGGTGYTQMQYTGTGRTYFTGVGNASETTFGVANKWYLFDQTAGTMRLAVDTNGNVGIGTTTPTQLLSVAGNMQLTGAFFDANNASGTNGQILTSTGTGTVWKSTSTLATSLGAFVQGGNTFGATGTLGTLDNNDLNIITNGTTKLTVLANGNVGIGTAAPTNALTFPAASTGIAFYNTVDQTTNFERGTVGWVGNVFTIKSGIGGTGTQRNISIGTTARAFLIDDSGASGAFYNFINGTGSTNPSVKITTTRTNAAGANVEFSISPTEVGSGTAGYTGLLINPTETSVGTGLKRLISAQVGGVDKFAVDNTGIVSVGTSSTSSAFTLQGQAGSAPLLTIASSTGSTLLTVLANGNVGIGTSGPSGILEVFAPGAGRTAGQLRVVDKNVIIGNLSTTVGDGSNLDVVDRFGNHVFFITSGSFQIGVGATSVVGTAFNIATTVQPAATSSYSLQVAAATGATTNYAATFMGGNVGIGTTTPTALFSVQGTSGNLLQAFNGATSELSLTSAGNLTINGNFTALGAGHNLGNLQIANSGSGVQFGPTQGNLGTTGQTWFQFNQGNGGNVWGPTSGNNVFLAINPSSTFSTGANLTQTVKIFQVNPNIAPLSAATSTGGQYVMASIEGAIGNGANFVYNSPLPLVGLQVSPSINVNTSSTGTYTSLLVNPTETSVGAGTLNYLARFQKGGVDKLVVTSAGNVGIGTSAPQQLLSVAGNMRLTGAFFDANNASGTVGQILTSTGTSTIWAAAGSVAGAFIQGGNTFGATGTLGTLDNNDLNIITNSTTKLTVLANGNVGIGTVNPGSPLDITGTSNTGSVPIASFFANNRAQNLALTFNSVIGSNALFLQSGTGNDMAFNTNGASEKMRITSGGNVGIGTTSPAATLDIRAPSPNVFVRATTGTNIAYQLFGNTGGNLYLGVEGSLGNQLLGTGSPFDAVIGTSLGTGFRLATNNATRLYLDPTGNVGIGTTTPSQKLVIQGTAGANDILNVASSSGASALYVASSGNVGIGTTTPAAKLDVYGSGTTDPLNVSSLSNISLFRIAANGNVNIGTTTPTGGGTATSAKLTIISPDTLVGPGLSIRQFGASNYGYDFDTENVSFGRLDLYGLTNGARTQLVTFLRTGNVGIATTSPTKKLVIGGGKMTDAQTVDGIYVAPNAAVVQITAETTGGIAGGFMPHSNGNFYMGSWSTNPVVFRAANADMMAILTNGNVGIGTTTPASKFVVAANCAGITGNPGTCTDFAEIYPSVNAVAAAELVSATDATSSSSGQGFVQKTARAYDAHLLGVVSSNPAIVIEGNSVQFMNGADFVVNPLSPAIALAGRVPVKIATSTSIHTGDFLTSSDVPGVAMKADHSGQVIGQALEDFDPSISTSTNPTVLVFVKSGYQVINNSFVIGENDGQLANATSTQSVNQLASSSLASSFLINQKGSGDLLQLQSGGQDRLLIANDGSFNLFASTTIATSTILSVTNGTTTQFSITAAGHISVGQDTAGSATIKAGDNQTSVVFDVPYLTVPKVVVTIQGLPDFNYGVATKTLEGFTIQIKATSTKDVSFDWIAVQQPTSTPSQSSLNTQIVVVSQPAPPSANIGGGGQVQISPVSPITPVNPIAPNPSNASSTPTVGVGATPPTDSGQVAPQQSSTSTGSGSSTGQVAGTSTPPSSAPVPTPNTTPPLSVTPPPVDQNPSAPPVISAAPPAQAPPPVDQNPSTPASPPPADPAPAPQ